MHDTTSRQPGPLAILHTYYFAETDPVEWRAIAAHFPSERVAYDISDLPPNSTILPRYRMLPFGDELETEARALGHTLINSWAQHRAVDDIFSWSTILGDLTAPAYRTEELDDVPEGRFVVKGEINSLKSRGPSAVFADSKAQALQLAQDIRHDPNFSNQVPVIRPLQDYELLGYNQRGLPVFNEFRVFVYRGTVVNTGFYWGNLPGIAVPDLDDCFHQTVSKAIDRVGHLAGFLVIDMARYTDGHWGVVELNEGCHAGCNETISADNLYRNLAAQDHAQDWN